MDPLPNHASPDSHLGSVDKFDQEQGDNEAKLGLHDDLAVPVPCGNGGQGDRDGTQASARPVPIWKIR